MSRIELRFPLCANLIVCVFLLAAVPSFSQQIVRRTSSPSIVSLGASPKPVGASLARRVGDSTFENAPPNYHVFSAVGVGERAAAEVLTLNFTGATTLTNIKLTNKDFVLEPGGSCYEGNHYASGQSCSLLVRFTPQGPGHRLGFLRIAHTAEANAASFGLTGNGYAPVVSFTPSQISTVTGSATSGTGTISTATSMAIDGGDILYIADTGNNAVKFMDSSGTLASEALGPIATPVSLAVDSFGILYTANVHSATYYFSIFYPWGSQTAYGYTYTSSTCTVAAPCAFSAVGMNYPANMSIDAFDNLFFEEGTTGAAEMPVASISGGSGTLNLWHLSDQFSFSSGKPGSFAVDSNGDLYTFYNFGTTTCYLIQEPLYDAEYSPTANRVAGGTKCGFAGDGGQARGAEISNSVGQMVFDTAGNLYFADAGNQRVRRIDALTGIISTIAGNGSTGSGGDNGAATTASLSSPSGIAVDSQGQVYILSNLPNAGPTQSLRKVGVKGYWNWGSVLKGTPVTKVFTVANTGNSSLTLSANASITGTNASDFTIDPTTTSCVLTSGAILPAGHSCNLGVIFKPSGGGSRTASILLEDNTIAGTNTIALVGTGTLPPATIAITAPKSGSTVTHGTTVTFTVSVTSTSSTKPTGNVTFKVNNSPIGSPVTISSGTASTTFSESTAATYTLSATYNGDSNYSPATATESLIVDAAPPVHILLQPVVGTASVCGVARFSVQVTSASGGTPTGSVALMSGSTKVSSANLRDGTALLSAGPTMSGLHTFVASYGGDSAHLAAVSAPLSWTIKPDALCGERFRFSARPEHPAE